MTYFHGGVPGLRLGDSILPPSRTGRTDSASRIAREEFGANHVRLDRVFLGASVDVAVLFAAMYPAINGGWVYEVEPVGELEADPDYLAGDGQSVQCAEAVIVRVVGRLPSHLVDSIRSAMVPA